MPHHRSSSDSSSSIMDCVQQCGQECGQSCSIVLDSSLASCACHSTSKSSSSKTCTSSSSSCPTSSSTACSKPCYPYPCYPYQRSNCEESCGFKAMIVPATNLHATQSTNQGQIAFLMRRKNKVVTLQWEPFTLQVGANGAAYLLVSQSISNLPPYTVQFPYRLVYNATGIISYIEIDPVGADQVKFYLNVSGSGSGVVIGDTVSISGSSISWITQ